MARLSPKPLSRLTAEHARTWRQIPWLVTFADMAILLMCFFIFVLSYTDVDLSRFEMISGSLNHTFGRERLMPIIAEPAKDWRIDHAGYDAQGNAAGWVALSAGGHDDNQSPDAYASLRVLGQALVDGKVEVVRMGEAVALHFTALEKNGRDPLGLKQTTIDALEDVARLSQMPAPVLTTTAPRTAPIDQTREPPALKEEPASDQSHVDEDEEAYAALKNDLSAPMGRDEVALVRGAHRITIRIGTAGAFAPASAELTASAHELIAHIQRITFAGHPDVVVSGHTDNVPISTQRYHDNWELASARALAVVRELQGAQNVPLGSLVAASYADTRPLVPNDSPENRERNRRVEIELHYR